MLLVDFSILLSDCLLLVLVGSKKSIHRRFIISLSLGLLLGLNL